MKYLIKESDIRNYIKTLIGEMKAYHGSRARFNKFDSSFNGSGEGSAAFGPGHYFTSSKDIAKDYANEHGTSKRIVPKFNIKHCGGDPTYQSHQLFYKLDNIVGINDYDSKNEHYLWKNLNVMLRTAPSKQKLIMQIYQYVIKAVKEKEDYSEDPEWYEWKLNKVLKFLKDNIEETERSIYQVELPNEDKFADWLMEVPEQWYTPLQRMITSLNDGEFINKFNNLCKEFIRRYGKLTVETLYCALNEMHYDATLGDGVFQWLLKRFGYIGVKYPSGTNFKTSSTKDGDMNYTVFNDSDIQLKKRWDL